MQDPNGLIKMPIMTVLFNTHRVGRGRHAKDYVVGLGSIFNIELDCSKMIAQKCLRAQA